MDPPSYGRGPSGEVWKLEDNIDSFIKLASQVISDNPLFFLVNSYTAGLSPSVIKYIIDTTDKLHGGTSMADELGLPVTETKLILPCGSAVRWQIN